MSFTEKVLLKSLRFTELNHETEVQNMVTEIMGLSSQIPKPTKPCAGEAVYFHSRRDGYVYSISAILCRGVARNIRQLKQPEACCFAVKMLLELINIH